MGKRLNKKEKIFCSVYSERGNLREAATAAGYIHPEISGLKLMDREEIVKEAGRMRIVRGLRNDALAGLRRIAFGSITDAVNLALAISKGENIEPEKLDLFSVSEIKVAKGGGIEFKFYDRLKALITLADAEMGSGSDIGSDFISAINKGAETIFETGRWEDGV